MQPRQPVGKREDEVLPESFGFSLVRCAYSLAIPIFRT
jgi:hypothetical protein